MWALGSIPVLKNKNALKKPSLAPRICDPSTGETEAGVLKDSLGYLARLCFKNKQTNKNQHTHIHTHTKPKWSYINEKLLEPDGLVLPWRASCEAASRGGGEGALSWRCL